VSHDSPAHRRPQKFSTRVADEADEIGATNGDGGGAQEIC